MESVGNAKAVNAYGHYDPFFLYLSFQVKMAIPNLLKLAPVGNNWKSDSGVKIIQWLLIIPL